MLLRLVSRMTLAVLCLLAAWLNAYAAEVAYVAKTSEQSGTRQQMEIAAKFYGLEADVTVLAGTEDDSAMAKVIRNPEIVAIAIAADTLPSLNQKYVLATIQKQGRKIPLFIVGITEQTSPALLRQWSAGAITGCKKSAIEQGTGWYAIAGANDITRQLGATKLPLNQEEVSYLTLDKGRGAQWLMAARLGTFEMPVFADAAISGQEVFFATATQAINIPVTPDPYRQAAVFATLAPPIMFLRYVAGERAWHSPGSYANLTIDDAWLRESYGYVNYEELLKQAQLHNFHATLAFVPWNFDRSQPATVSLFRAHPDRLSITIHGNNHDHQEFGAYNAHPLQGQVEDIKQGIARMERFSQRTGIPYDAVMVFPHSISPEATLAVLKRYNFLGTANSLNVPSDATAPADPEFALRTATLQFADFPSLRRYSAEAPIPDAQLAIDAFFGNPLLFYVHEGFFAPGIGAFNTIADRVNQLQPDTQWMGLGYIAQHLYLEKLRDDGNYDVRLFTGTIHLSNTRKRDATFFLEKEEDFALPVTVHVDGQLYPYERAGTQLRIQLPVRDGMSRTIEIKYQNDLNLAAISVSKTSLRVNAIRQLSDFRDNVVSKTGPGRWLIRSYSENGAGWNRAVSALTGLLAFVAAFCYRYKGKSRSSASRDTSIHALRNRT
jgi:hydroxypyruvate isomerase